MSAAVTRIDYTQPTPDGHTIVLARMDAQILQVRVPGPTVPGASSGLATYTTETRTVWLLQVLPDATPGQNALLGNLWETMPMRTAPATVQQATDLAESVGAMVWGHLMTARDQAAQLRQHITKAVDEVHP